MRCDVILPLLWALVMFVTIVSGLGLSISRAHDLWCYFLGVLVLLIAQGRIGF
jgi:hypothetical protein